jgi:hypothetical protein
LFKRRTIEHTSGVRDGWELALEVVSRLDDAEKLQKSVSELLDKIPLDNVEQLDKVVLLCSELGLDKEGRRVSEVRPCLSPTLVVFLDLETDRLAAIW